MTGLWLLRGAIMDFYCSGNGIRNLSRIPRLACLSVMLLVLAGFAAITGGGR